jgi:hypothetical protein
MAESKKSSSGGSGSSRSKKSGSSRSRKSRSGSGSRGSKENGAMSKAAEAQTGGKPMGRPPAEEPDVWVNVPELHVGELNIDVEQLQAQLALRAQVANLVNLTAGVQVSIDKVNIDIKDVDARAELKVRLQNTYNILDRTLTTLDENPELIKGALETADTAVQETGQVGKGATQSGGALSELSSGVGDTLGNVGDTVSSIAGKANPKQLTSGSSGGSKKSGGDSSASGLGKDAAAAGVAGVAGILGGVLLGQRRRNGLSGFFRRNGSIAKQIGKPRKLSKARKTAGRVLP